MHHGMRIVPRRRPLYTWALRAAPVVPEAIARQCPSVYCWHCSRSIAQCPYGCPSRGAAQVAMVFLKRGEVMYLSPHFFEVWGKKRLYGRINHRVRR